MRLTKFVAILFMMISGPTAAYAQCSASFQGWWSTDIGPINQQYLRMIMYYNTHGSFHFRSLTSLTPFKSDRTSNGVTGPSTNRIVDISYDSWVNLESKRTGANSCRLTFGRANINQDTYNAYQQYAQSADLTVSGKTLNWCWSRSGHHGGDCITFTYVKD